MPRLFHHNPQLKNRTVEMALSDGTNLNDRRQLDLNVFKKHGNALKITEHVYGTDQVDGKYYDGSSPSKVIGTEITKIKGLDKEELAAKGIEAGFQLYMMVVNGNEIETGLPSFLDKESGKKKLVNLNNYDLTNIEELLIKLPEGSKIMLVWQLDINRTNDVDLEKSIVSSLPFSNNPKKERDNPGVQFIAPPKAVGDGTFSEVDLPDTSVDLESKHEGEDGKVVSIVETLLFKGTHEDPVDLGMIAQALVEKAKSFDGTQITLSDMQYVLFVLPKNEPHFDAGNDIKFESGLNVSLLEVISKQQIEKKLGEFIPENLIIDKIQTPAVIEDQFLKKIPATKTGQVIIFNKHEQNQDEIRMEHSDKIKSPENIRTYKGRKLDLKYPQFEKNIKSPKLMQPEGTLNLMQPEGIYLRLGFSDIPRMHNRSKDEKKKKSEEKRRAHQKGSRLKESDKKRIQKQAVPLARKAIAKTTLAKKEKLKRSRKEFDKMKDSKALPELKLAAKAKINIKPKSAPRSKPEKTDAIIKPKTNGLRQSQKKKERRSQFSQEAREKVVSQKTTKEKTAKAVKADLRKKDPEPGKNKTSSNRITKKVKTKERIYPHFYREMLGLGITWQRTMAKSSPGKR